MRRRRWPGTGEGGGGMKFLNDLTIQQLVARGTAYLVLAAILGGAIALAAALAERRRDWRRVRDAFEHVSMPGMVMAVLFRQGWLRLLAPVPGRHGALAAWGAALAVPVLLVALVRHLRPFLADWGLGPWARFGLGFAQEFQAIAAGIWAFSLVPLPPLAGGYLLAAAAPRAFARLARWQEALAGALMIALVAGWIPALGGRVLPWMLWLGGGW